MHTLYSRQHQQSFMPKTASSSLAPRDKGVLPTAQSGRAAGGYLPGAGAGCRASARWDSQRG